MQCKFLQICAGPAETGASAMARGHQLGQEPLGPLLDGMQQYDILPSSRLGGETKMQAGHVILAEGKQNQRRAKKQQEGDERANTGKKGRERVKGTRWKWCCVCWQLSVRSKLSCFSSISGTYLPWLWHCISKPKELTRMIACAGGGGFARRWRAALDRSTVCSKRNFAGWFIILSSPRGCGKPCRTWHTNDSVDCKSLPRLLLNTVPLPKPLRLSCKYTIFSIQLCLWGKLYSLWCCMETSCSSITTWLSQTQRLKALFISSCYEDVQTCAKGRALLSASPLALLPIHCVSWEESHNFPVPLSAHWGVIITCKDMAFNNTD